MINAIFKKKLSDEQLASYFVNGIIDVVEKGFGEVKSIIREDPAFVIPPNLEEVKNGHFAMIVVVGNWSVLSDYLPLEKKKAVQPIIFHELSQALHLKKEVFQNLYREYHSFMSRVNHPSKIMLYSMSKAMFFKYDLNDYQNNHFSRLNTPNPLFLKRMDKVMQNFLWDWETFFKKYKVH